MCCPSHPNTSEGLTLAEHRLKYMAVNETGQNDSINGYILE